METTNDSEDELLASTPKKHSSTTTRAVSIASPTLQHRPKTPRKESVDAEKKRDKSTSAESENKPQVVISSGPVRPWEYQSFDHSKTIDEILKEVEGPDGKTLFRVQFEDGHDEVVDQHRVSEMRNGTNALNLFWDKSANSASGEERSTSAAQTKRTRPPRKVDDGMVSTETAHFGSDDDEFRSSKKRKLEKGKSQHFGSGGTRQSSRVSARQGIDEVASSESEDEPVRRSTRQSSRAPGKWRPTRSSSRHPGPIDDDDELAAIVPDSDSEEEDDDDDEIVYAKPGRKRPARKTRQNQAPARGKKGAKGNRVSSRLGDKDEESDESFSEQEPTRKSGRSTKIKYSMREQDLDDEIYADEVATNNTPKVISVREVFQVLPDKDPFRVLHRNVCDVCSGHGSHSNKGTSPLIYCQGCSTAIHKVCLGYRSGREHMVTKVGKDNFVMQCRRCIGIASKKDSSAPRLDVCQGCDKSGPACAAFSKKKTSKQEEKLREENDGEDPITEVSPDLVNNADNVLFRCNSCQRAYHFHHLPPRRKNSKKPSDQNELRDARYGEYTPDYKCKECCEQDAKVHTLVAWRPIDRESYVEEDTVDMFREDQKEYLVKWEEKSYFQCSWMPGAWVWGITAVTMRKAFIRRDEGANLLPKWTFEEAVPEEFLRMEIIFDVHYSDDFEAESEAADKENIADVEEVLVKFQGLGYEESVWESPPSPDETSLWAAFVSAYNEYVVGKYFEQSSAAEMKKSIDDFRALDFENDIMVQKQPTALTGGELMPYQRSGLNWLLENYHGQRNVILADEMGLGKTIQIISMLASLVKDSPQCSPFLVVTPNSTCPNWRREMKQWAPSLRVVAYYGGKKARDMAMKYELYPDGAKHLCAHVVITSYEAPGDPDSRSFFKKIKWAGMIVDEGQRLKNDANQLYLALKAMKVPFRVLLTGTPLQNNTRELFNLIQFLDEKQNAAELDEEYTVLTNENIKKLQAHIEPFFLRRTKQQVLKFLPPMAQVIVPVTMSVLQKKLYKSILAKNPELIKSIFGQSKTAMRPQERGSLNNILMQLRKVLCHPFIYSSAVEEKSTSADTDHRNLVDASSKLQLLEIMLPKLRERGHRVLIFSQFLEQLTVVEDFLDHLNLPFKRLDGSISALEKQKRIDAFNAPDSPLFAFLLSTRAGGVGINLATADTVIIMDADFNPHQDIQALSRAHRIGQKKKVLVFQLLTKDTAEERIAQIGRKKMALDHALIETMGTDDDTPRDLESILRHGAEALFNDDDSNDIRYDSASIDKLLDRTQIENTSTDDDKIAESAFLHARVWSNDKHGLVEDSGESEAALPNASVWEKILKQREADAAAEAAKNMVKFGRGQRVRQTIDYQKSDMQLDDAIDSSPAKGRKRDSESDVEFAAGAESDDDDFDAPRPGDVDVNELSTGRARRTSGSPLNKQATNETRHTNHGHPTPVAVPINFPAPSSIAGKRNDRGASRGRGIGRGNPAQSYSGEIVPRIQGHPGNERRPSYATNPTDPNLSQPHYTGNGGQAYRWTSNAVPVAPQARQTPNQSKSAWCEICQSSHVKGQCDVRVRGVEHCGLCNIAHFGISNTCPHISSDIHIRLMLDALKSSPEPSSQVEAARNYLLGILSDRAKRRSRPNVDIPVKKPRPSHGSQHS